MAGNAPAEGGYELGFADLGLSEALLAAVRESGYDQPTPIQRKAIPNVLLGNDLVGQAQTGTGKTAGFVLPMLDILQQGRARARMPRSLILEPTRELAQQVANSFDRYGQYMRLSKALLIGGESLSDQERQLARGVDVLIATPGRLIDLFERSNLILTDVRLLVIDEADRMLDMGFIPAIDRICRLLPRKRQSLMFSATMPKEIRRLANDYLRQPKEVAVDPPDSAAETVQQYVVQTSASGKREALKALLNQVEVDGALVFCNRKRDVDSLQRHLKRNGYNAAALHGDMPQPARMETLAQLDKRDVTCLICSDVAARGLDLKGLSHVFNYDVPTHAEDYVHRIGRTGRAGKRGEAYTLATPEDGRYLAQIEKLTGGALAELTLEAVSRVEVPREGPTKRGRKRGKGDADKPAGEAAQAAETDTAKTDKPQEDQAKRPQAKGNKPKDREKTRGKTAGKASQPAAAAPAEDAAPAAEPAEAAPAGEPEPAPARRGGRRKAAAKAGDAEAAGEGARSRRRGKAATGEAEAASGASGRRGGGGKRRSSAAAEADEPSDRSALMIGSGDDIPAFLKRPARPRALEQS